LLDCHSKRREQISNIKDIHCETHCLMHHRSHYYCLLHQQHQGVNHCNRSQQVSGTIARSYDLTATRSHRTNNNASIATRRVTSLSSYCPRFVHSSITPSRLDDLGGTGPISQRLEYAGNHERTRWIETQGRISGQGVIACNNKRFTFRLLPFFFAYSAWTKQSSFAFPSFEFPYNDNCTRCP
jgi:hypothetical protein